MLRRLIWHRVPDSPQMYGSSEYSGPGKREVREALTFECRELHEDLFVLFYLIIFEMLKKILVLFYLIVFEELLKFTKIYTCITLLNCLDLKRVAVVSVKTFHYRVSWFYFFVD